MRLIRSKGVGVFFVTQSPKDVPGDVLAQLGNRVQHALRAYTPDDAAALRAAVTTYPHTDYDLEELLTTLGTGEAVVTVLSEKGAPTPVAWTRMRAPESLMAPSPDAVVEAAVASSQLRAEYGTALERDSALELLDTARAERERAAQRATETKAQEPGIVEQVVKSSAFRSALRSAGTVIGREITRSIFGTSRRR